MPPDAISDLQTQLAHLKWRKVSNNNKIQAKIATSKSLVERDLLLALSQKKSTLKAQWRATVIEQELAKPLEIATFHSGVGGLVLALGAPWFLILPDAAVWGDLAAAALLTVIGAAALAWGYAREEAQVLVPMEYSGFLWASLFGWMFFREAVPLTTIGGVLLIVAGCWIATRRKRPEQSAV